MKALSLTLAVIAAVAIGIAAPAAFAKRHQQCPPGSEAAEYCQSDPGYDWHHGRRDHGRRDHGRSGHDARHGR